MSQGSKASGSVQQRCPRSMRISSRPIATGQPTMSGRSYVRSGSSYTKLRVSARSRAPDDRVRNRGGDVPRPTLNLNLRYRFRVIDGRKKEAR